MKLTLKILSRSLFSAGALFAALGFTMEAKAEARTHDGFYLHFDAGLGYLSSSAEALGQEITYSGVTFPASLLLGGTVGPVAFGGGFFTDYAPSPSASFNGTSVDLDNVDVDLYLIGLGLFADVYPDPKKGLHFLPFVGWGGLEASVEGNVGGSDPTGLILSMGVGYDFWISNQWSAGVMGRFAYAPLSLNDVSYTTIAPALLGTITYH